MDSNLFALCKAVLLWWDSEGFQIYFEAHKPMPSFVKEALEILGSAIVNMQDEEIEE